MTSKPFELAQIDPGATVTELDRPGSSAALRRNATEVIPNESSGMQSWSTAPVSPSHAPAGATQLIEVPRPIIQPDVIIQPAAIIDVAPKRDAVASEVTIPKPTGPTDTAPAQVSRPKLSASPVIVLSPAQAEPSRPVVSPKFEPLSAPASRAPAATKAPSLATVLETPLVRMPPVESAATPSRRGSSEDPPSAVARLGILTRRYPVGVIGGAIVGAMVLGVFLVGAAEVLGLRASASGVSVTANAPRAKVALSKPAAGPAVAATPSVALAQTTASNVPESTPRAAAVPPAPQSEVDPNLPNAVGALFSGRLIEAEQAYRDLAARHPEEPTYSALARILARRNSADCRPGSPTQKACPTVKP
jgi:hypothetical protein